MIKRAFSVMSAFFAVYFLLSAHEAVTADTIRPAEFVLNQASPSDLVEGPIALERTGSFRALSNVWYGRGPLTLGDGRFFSFPSAFGWVEGAPGDFLPAFTVAEMPRVTSITTPAQASADKTVDLLPKFDYVGGEVGVFYGRSTGKFNREVEQGYILGEVMDGDTHILVGGSYEHSSGRVPRIIGR